MAVGISLLKSRVDEFRAQFSEAVRRQTGEGIAEIPLSIATWLTPDSIDSRLMDELECLHPFGQGNPEPVFGLRSVTLKRRPEVFKERRFRFWLEDAKGRSLHGVAWKMADRQPPLGCPIDLAVELNWNYFNDRKLLQLELVDWRLSQAS